jgi:hypothetical protein
MTANNCQHIDESWTTKVLAILNNMASDVQYNFKLIDFTLTIDEY